jgi:hypothetical protein
MRALAALLALAAGCAHLSGEGPARLDTVTVEGQAFRLQYWPEDEEAARQVRTALALAVPRVARWGRLVAPVLVTIHPSHQALEAAVQRQDHSWLRAWARYASIDLQSPRTWEPPDVLLGGPTDEQVAELLAHELVHCVMYQAVGGEATWTQRDIPLWFREGLASVVAGQGYKRVGPEAIWRFYRDASGGGDGEPARARVQGDPLTDPEPPPGEPLDKREADLVYGTAHRAFQFLLDRYGQARVRGVLERMRRGQPFGGAFQAEIGIDPRAFADDFKRYIVFQGWRRER